MRASGARVLAGGRREGAIYRPTVVAVYRVGSLAEAIDRANAVDYGLHARIFTNNLADAFEAVRRLQAGAVIVNDSTDYRLDVMPFGGLKRSGIGREGIRHALEDMTETRVVCLNL